MESYKKKLLERYPDQSKQLSKEKAEERTSKQDLEHLRQVLHADLEKNLRELQNAAHEKKAGPTRFWLASLFIILVLVGTTGWATVFWLENRVRPDVDDEIEKMQEYATNKIDEIFSSDEIQEVIQNEVKQFTREKIETIVEVQANQLLDPWRGQIREMSEQLRSESQTALNNLNAVTEVMVSEAKAKNDDRQAFEKLLTISRDRNHSYKKVAADAIKGIFRSVNTMNRPVLDIPDPTRNEAVGQLSYETFKKLYAHTIPLYKPWLLTELWESNTYSKYQKLEFLTEVIRGDSSLAALERACRLMDFEVPLNKPFTAYDFYLTWWAENKASYAEVSAS